MLNALITTSLSFDSIDNCFSCQFKKKVILHKVQISISQICNYNENTNILVYQDNELYDNISFDKSIDPFSFTIKQYGEVKVLVVSSTFQYSFFRANTITSSQKKKQTIATIVGIAAFAFTIAFTLVCLKIIKSREQRSKNIVRRTVIRVTPINSVNISDADLHSEIQ
ncbi:Hypothetical_protein [Hexamita inflata]|uniref:Hypothetical_protein n=1 Tax=Hexamita inflata TaxID=28002 RepID=A0AA86PQM8_9EUKA|nr:Hypothetical protein HINF_LOCUS26919 [Hexamita inflata]CAI9939277.1 Hypothetical protein HINF_LOCUS26922 [Hexamita inflata]